MLDCPRSGPEALGPRADPDRPSRAAVRATILRTGPQIRGPGASLRWRAGPGRARAMARTYPYNLDKMCFFYIHIFLRILLSILMYLLIIINIQIFTLQISTIGLYSIFML
jgi:hypothetical protein